MYIMHQLNYCLLDPYYFCQIQVLTYLLVHQMVPTSLGYILLDIQCLGHLFHHFIVVPFLSPMLFQLVELCMDQLELFLMSLNLEVEVLGLDVAMLVLLLAVISHTSKAHNKMLEIWALTSTFLLWKILIASHLWVVHYLNLDLSIMFVSFLVIARFTFEFCTCIQSHVVSIFLVCDRCQFKVQAKHFVMDFPWLACLRFSSHTSEVPH